MTAFSVPGSSTLSPSFAASVSVTGSGYATEERENDSDTGIRLVSQAYSQSVKPVDEFISAGQVTEQLISVTIESHQS